MPFATWWRGDPLPELAPLPSWSARRITRWDEARRITGLTEDRVVLRFQAGHRPYAAFLDDEPVAFGWAAKHPSEEERLRGKAREALYENRREARGTNPLRAPVGWEEPVPIGTREAAFALQIELLPDWMAEWVAAITAEKGAAPDLGASLALGVVAGGIARNVQVSPRPGWYEPTCLYVIVALPPGLPSGRMNMR